MVREAHTALVVLGNQLFPRSHLANLRGAEVFMAEDEGLCTYVRHHKQKLVFFLAAMRHYAEGLRRVGFRVHYEALGREPKGAPGSYEDKLAAFVERQRVRRLVMFEVEDSFFERRLVDFARRQRLELQFMASPMFLTARPVTDLFLSRQRKPLMASFYRWQRRNLDVLITSAGAPVGGRWSFDQDNRKSLPPQLALPAPLRVSPTEHVRELIPLVNQRFAQHPGELSEGTWWLPVTRPEALSWLQRFLEERFPRFGDYEDALSSRSPTLFHAVISPLLNAGLLTPAEVVEESLAAAQRNGVPLNAVEGFVRQVIGWREFVRAVYHRHGAWEMAQNHFHHERQLTPAWTEARTGIPPLDDVIRKAQRMGWAHHIERLMVLGNLMTLCEIEPHAAYRYFMEMFVDSSDWVMVPNVFGMALFADGGLFATKPYVCGSNYLLRMSDYERPTGLRGPHNWCDVVDGLYWRFVDKQKETFANNPRLKVQLQNLAGMPGERKTMLFEAAEAFLARYTRLAAPVRRAV
ncbi:MAG: cryptochrome/photolyase family protein [Myxococcales bacterium]|nr:cryptochrome/photolyase family protein [Myxococcales bacterium]